MNNIQRNKRQQQQQQRQPAAAVPRGSASFPSPWDRKALAKTELAGAWPCPKN
jgi:hypothetical protein